MFKIVDLAARTRGSGLTYAAVAADGLGEIPRTFSAFVQLIAELVAAPFGFRASATESSWQV
jgi:hypothetical protein